MKKMTEAGIATQITTDLHTSALTETNQALMNLAKATSELSAKVNDCDIASSSLEHRVSEEICAIC
jgi:hypothetical protein